MTTPEERAERAAYMREWNRRNPDKVKAAKKRSYERNKERWRARRIAYAKERRQRPEAKAKDREWREENAERIREGRRRTNAAYARRHPGRIGARNAVYYALKTGKLTRGPCAECGAEPTQAHHHRGYAKEHRLDVIWLCVGCHATQRDTS